MKLEVPNLPAHLLSSWLSHACGVELHVLAGAWERILLKVHVAETEQDCGEEYARTGHHMQGPVDLDTLIFVV